MTIRTAVSGSLLLFCTLATAQDNPWNVSGFASYLDPDSDRRIVGSTTAPLDDDIGWAFALGYRFSPKWEGRFITNEWDLNHTANGYGLDALYHFNDKNLYGIGGYKHADINGGDDNLLNLGLGKRFGLTDNLYFTAEALVTQSLENSFNDFGVNLGLTYQFGKKAVAPKPKPTPKPPARIARKDSDGDGVYDDKDSCPNTSMSDAVDSTGCPRYTMEDESINLSINFANNNDAVAKHYYGEIERVAAFMKKFPESTVVIEGHTSVQGKASYNQVLSERRAKMVANILVSQFGVNANRVSHAGFGETRLVNQDNTPAAAQQNRRIEARISGSKKVKIKR
jgi:OOP family OmpA-OmpF porin